VSAQTAIPTKSLDVASIDALFAKLVTIFGGRVTISRAVREHHSLDEGHREGLLPDLVAFPRSTEEIAGAMRMCADARCPVLAWGAGTSLEGNALAASGGLCLDMSQMAQVLEVRPEDLTATVQAGVRRVQLNDALKGTGLFFAIDPGADATLGGMAATRASGTNAVRYGTMRANVLSCTAVLADGNVIRTARRAPKSAAGYDLTALLVGSEGTLGIITELTVRLHPLPEEVALVVCPFETLQGAVEAASTAIQMGLGVARIELLDDDMMIALRRLEEGATYPEQHTLFVEFHGAPASVQYQVQQFDELARSLGGVPTQPAVRQEDRTALWKARHNALYAARALQPGKRVLITDVCVPISRLTECLVQTRLDLDRSPLVSTIAGHVGDGNFHCFILVDPAIDEEMHEAERLHERMARRAIEMDGSCTGEHGIGLGKQHLLVEELGSALAPMMTIKRALDPGNILNPGKIFQLGP
jgi:D-lactate dehydrogenase (cytochrome)